MLLEIKGFTSFCARGPRLNSVRSNNPQIILSSRTGMGIIARGAKCNVIDCDKEAVRSLTTSKVEGTGLSISGDSKKTTLCKEHYKEWKKATKEERDVERARYDRF